MAALMTEAELEQELRKIAPPPEFAGTVARWDVQIRDDWAGDPATEVTVIIKDADLRRAWPHRRKYGRSISEKLRELLPERFPYVWFQSESPDIDPEPRESRRQP
ncbi:MAG: hypothetical protein ACKVVT_02360 [Dehalococcoidia bacterium]